MGIKQGGYRSLFKTRVGDELLKHDGYQTRWVSFIIQNKGW